MTVNLLENGFYLEFKYQTCFDDGGIGHDCWWEKIRERLDAKTEKEAKEKAKEILKVQHSCNGSFCDNRGLRQFIKLEKVSTKIEREVKQLGLPK